MCIAGVEIISGGIEPVMALGALFLGHRVNHLLTFPFTVDFGPTGSNIENPKK